MRKIGKSACYDSGATAHAMKLGDDYIPTNIPSDKVSEIPDGKNLYGSKNLYYIMKYEIQQEQQR